MSSQNYNAKNIEKENNNNNTKNIEKENNNTKNIAKENNNNSNTQKMKLKVSPKGLPFGARAAFELPIGTGGREHCVTQSWQ
jgi:hypothetical protein